MDTGYTRFEIMKTQVYSKETFIKEMNSRGINDSTVSSVPEYFICIDPTGGPHSVKFFKEEHPNVIRLQFDDCESDETKWGENIQAFYEAKAMVLEQAEIIVNFVKSMPADAIVNIFCTKGMSRSVAVASFLNNTEGGNKHVLKLLKQAWTGK